MKIYLPLLFRALAGSAQAQSNSKSKIKLEKRPLILESTNSITRKVGDKVRFTVWAEGLAHPPYSNGMQDSSPYKPFGTLWLDGEVYWNKAKLDRSYSYSWAAGRDEGLVFDAGQRIPLSADTARTDGRNFEIGVGYGEPALRNFRIALKLYHLLPHYSAGNGASPEHVKELQEQNDRNYANPPLMGNFNVGINLSNIAEKKRASYVWTWSNGDRLGSKLHVEVQHTGYMYKANVPQVGPVIKKPQLPGPLPGPGPVIKGGPRVIKPSTKQKTQVR